MTSPIDAAPIAPAPTPVAPATTALPAPTARFVGRFDTSDPSAPRFAWSGSTIAARFEGTGVSARLRDDGRNSFTVVVDGVPQGIVKTYAKKEAFVLAQGLPPGPHEVLLHKRTEARVGEVTFLGFEPQGTMLPAPPAPARRIELIGDSITTGYGNGGPGPTCTFNPDEQDHYATYGALAARALDAEQVTIAWSGKTIGEMTEYYERTLPARAESSWSAGAWTPQLVVLNVGTNNFAVRDPGEERFVRIYTALFNRVRRAYPDAFIVCALGPMLTDVYPEGRRNLTTARKYMGVTMAKLAEGGSQRFAFLEFPEQRHADGLGCGFHPSKKTHERMAERLVALAREKLGW